MNASDCICDLQGRHPQCPQHGVYANQMAAAGLTHKRLDPVNPSHYVKRGIEVRHVIRAFECSYNIGTAIAYLLRAPFKKDYLEDLKKAAKHIQFELEDKGGGGDGVDRDRTK